MRKDGTCGWFCLFLTYLKCLYIYSFLFIAGELWSGPIWELYFENGFVLQFKEWTNKLRVTQKSKFV